MQKSNTKEILDASLDYAISLYIKPGENKDNLLKKFNGDKLATVKYMRNREMEGITVIKIEHKKSKSKPKKKQRELF